MRPVFVLSAARTPIGKFGGSFASLSAADLGEVAARPALLRSGLPPAAVDITLQTDAQTLRPAHLVADAKSADGTVDIHAVLDAGHWDEDLVIDEPSSQDVAPAAS